MAAPNPIIPKLLSLKQKDQERRLNEIQTEIRMLEAKLSDFDRELASLDGHADGMGRLSIENGYVRFIQHRQGILLDRIAVLRGDAAMVQNELRKSVFSQSMLKD